MKQLLVEGKNDLHIISALCLHHAIPENFEVIDCEGVVKLLGSLSTRLKQSRLDALAIVVDADTDINTRWQSLQSKLATAGYTLPNQPPLDGFFDNSKKVKLGVWVMPNNQLNGMVEDFIKLLIPQNDQLLPIAENVLNDIESKKLNQYKLVHKPKALVHTWLAWQAEPGIPMGQAITKYALGNSLSCRLLIDWLTKVFA